jgi:DNA-binding NarL/FixJ family response regulator
MKSATHQAKLESPDFDSAGPHQVSSEDRGAKPHVHLTNRELEVLALLCEGMPNKLIARRLKISAGTVKVHISRILRALGVATRLQAVLLARSHTNVREPDREERRPRLNGARHR